MITPPIKNSDLAKPWPAWLSFSIIVVVVLKITPGCGISSINLRVNPVRNDGGLTPLSIRNEHFISISPP